MLKLKNKQKFSLSSLFPKPVMFSPVRIDHEDELLQAIEQEAHDRDDDWVLEDPKPEELQNYLQAALEDSDE
jgi:hypothetical protein